MTHVSGVGGGRCVSEALERRQLLAASMEAFAIGGTGGDTATGVYVDRRNRTYVVGEFTGNVDFQKGVGARFVDAGSKADPDQQLSYVAKYDPDGRVEWVRAFDDPDVSVAEVETDSNGHVYVSGSYTGRADLDPSRRQLVLKSAGSSNFVAKFTAGGKLIWARAVGTGGARMAVDAAGGNVFLVGRQFQFRDDDPNLGVDLVDERVERNLVKLDADGRYVWHGAIGADVQDVEASRRGGVFLAGTVKGSADVDPGPGEHLLTPNGRPLGAYVQAIDADGTLAWATVDGEARNTQGRAVTVDAFDNVIVAAVRLYRRPMGNDDGPNSVLLIKYDSAGRQVWRRASTGGTILTVNGVDTDDAGDIVLAGIYRGKNLVDGTQPDFGNGVAGGTPPPAEGYDATYVARYAADGTFEDLDTAIVEEDLKGAFVTELAVRRSGEAVVVGVVGGTVDLDDGPGVVLLASLSPDLGFINADGDGFVWELRYS